MKVETVVTIRPIVHLGTWDRKKGENKRETHKNKIAYQPARSKILGIHLIAKSWVKAKCVFVIFSGATKSLPPRWG